MGSKCFRPTKQRNEPVYVSSLSKAMADALIVYQAKTLPRQKVIEEIVANENQKGNLKRLFDHLSSHQSSVIQAIKECNRRVSFDKAFSAVVIASVFCNLLVKMISNKKLKLYLSQIQQTNNQNQIESKRNLVINSYGLRNLIYQLQSHFFQLVIKILVYSKQKKLYNSISQILIQYTNACEDKIVAKKELKNILDLYLNAVFEKNIQLINKQSFLPFFAYSVLLSKSKSQLFTSEFIQKHFNFILKIFFELEDSKASSKSLIESQEFSLFEDSIENIIKEFIVFSLENKKTKEHILAEIMFQSDSERFLEYKMVKLENLIRENLNVYNCEHFMMDWLIHLLRYISKMIDNQNESIRESLLESLHQASIHATITSMKSLKNMNDVPTDSKANAIETFLRWFQSGLLDMGRTLQLFSLKIFSSLLLNLYQQGNTSGQQQVIASVKKLLGYILSRQPERIKDIFLLINKQIRRNKNQFYLAESHNLSFSRSSAKGKQFPIIQDEAAEILWRNNIKFISEQSGLLMDESQFTKSEAEELYAPVSKHSKTSINLVYLIELAAIGFRYLDLTQNQPTQQLIYNFLCSLINSMKVPQTDIEYEYLYNLSQKLKLLSTELITKNDQILCSFFQYSFKNLLKQNGEQVWLSILVTVIVASMAIEKYKDKNKKRLEKLSWFLEDLFSIIKKDDFFTEDIYKLYNQNKSLFDVSLRISAKFQNIKLKTLQHLQKKAPIQVPSKSLSNIQGSVISSQFEVSSNPDSQFAKVFKIVSKE